jgi:hypothetical protein
VAKSPLSRDEPAPAAGPRPAAISKQPKPKREATPPDAGKKFSQDDVDEAELLANPQLTKAEKRKLRKKLRRHQRQAA